VTPRMAKMYLRRALVREFLPILSLGSLMLAGCGGGPTNGNNGSSSDPNGNPTPPANVAGSWEFIAKNPVNSQFTVLTAEVNLREGIAIGNSQSPNDVSAQNSQVNLIAYDSAGDLLAGGPCPGNNGVNGALNGSMLDASFIEDGVNIPIQGTFQGTAAFSGTYTATAPGAFCTGQPGTGTITGRFVPPFAGTWSGKINSSQWNNFGGSVSLTFTESTSQMGPANTGYALKVNASYLPTPGNSAVGISLTGFVIGASIQIWGTDVSQNPIGMYGYSPDNKTLYLYDSQCAGQCSTTSTFLGTVSLAP